MSESRSGVGSRGELGEIAGDLAADARDPGAVGVGEDVLLAPREADVGQRLAERVGDLGEIESLLAVRAAGARCRQSDDLRRRGRRARRNGVFDRRECGRCA